MRTTFLWVTWRASSSSRLKRRSRSARLLADPARLRPDDLERDRHAELRVPRLVHRAHAADAEQPDDVVARAEVLAVGEGLVLLDWGSTGPVPSAVATSGDAPPRAVTSAGGSAAIGLAHAEQ